MSGTAYSYAQSDSAYCGRCYRSVVCPSVRLSVCIYICMSSVTVVHSAKAVGWNEVPFGRDAREVPSNIVSSDGHQLLLK